MVSKQSKAIKPYYQMSYSDGHQHVFGYGVIFCVSDCGKSVKLTKPKMLAENHNETPVELDIWCGGSYKHYFKPDGFYEETQQGAYNEMGSLSSQIEYYEVYDELSEVYSLDGETAASG